MSQGQAVTIADMAAAQQVDLKRGSLEIVADEFEVSDLMTFSSTNGAMQRRVARINPEDQPPQSYRALNSDGVFSAGSMESISENLTIYHAAVKIDKYILGDSTLLWKPSTQLDFINRQMAREMVNAMINGDPTQKFNTDGSGRPAFQPAGIFYRVKNPTFYGLDQDMWTTGFGRWATGSPLDLTAITSTIANNLYDALDELQRQTHANVCFMNGRMLTLFARAWRLGGMLKTTEDQLGRKWQTILGMRIIDPGLKFAARRTFNPADTSAWVISYTDVNGVRTPTASAGSQYTFIPVARVGPGYFEGLTAQGVNQEGPIKLPPPSQASAYQIDFAYGFMANTPHDLGGLYAIKIG